jgi:hypothetical protein
MKVNHTWKLSAWTNVRLKVTAFDFEASFIDKLNVGPFSLESFIFEIFGTCDSK